MVIQGFAQGAELLHRELFRPGGGWDSRRLQQGSHFPLGQTEEAAHTVGQSLAALGKGCLHCLEEEGLVRTLLPVRQQIQPDHRGVHIGAA